MRLKGGLLFLIVAVGVATSQDDLVKDAVKEAKKIFNDRQLTAMMAGAQSSKQPDRSKDKSTPQSRKMSEIVAIYDIALDILVNKHSMAPKDAQDLILSARQTLPECQMPTITCNAAEHYRRINGECNNLQNGHWGTTHMPLKRVIPPEYAPGNEPRGGRITTLPEPRRISQVVHKGVDDDNAALPVTHMIAQFGQFLDHDITATPEGGKACCGSTSPDAECFTIVIDKSQDDHYQDPITGKDCLDFTRSLANCRTSSPNREQMNAITAFVDASNVYGSDDRLTKMLRKFSGGEMAVNSEISEGFLPWRADVDPSIEDKGSIIAGDVRANEMPALTVMHTLFLKEHNRLAREFQLRTNWSDEQIFQESRRIVIAEMQQITYGEYLPATLGAEAMAKYGLALGPLESAYDPNSDPTITNAFATAAYRFGHTLVNGLIKKMLGDAVTGTYPISDNYFLSDQIVDRSTGRMYGYAPILNGLIRQSAQQSDAIISDGMRNSLFKRADDIGSDLAARNIQRGRDHGIPGYNKFRVSCGLPALTNWDNPPAEIPLEAWNKLRTAYHTSPTPTDNLDDIDLYTGGLSESPVNGGQAGPTFVCLMGDQFQKLKFGDRFFFTHASQAGSFSWEQLAQLRRRTLGDIICENTIRTELSETQGNVFHTAGALNPMTSCESTARQKLDMDLFANSFQGTTTTSSPPRTTPSNGAGKNSGFSIMILSVLFRVLY